MKFRRAAAQILTGACLISWAGPSFALRAPQRADDPSGRGSVANALTSGLEEDPLLAIWQRNKGKPPFMDPLERPQLLKEWNKFFPWVKKHLEDPDSPIPRFLLWDMLLSENWEREMEKRAPSQWIWLADQILPRWKGGEDSSKGGQRLQELKLLAALDRLLLIRAQKDVSAGMLVGWHHRILAAWNRELSRGDPNKLSEEWVVSFLGSLKGVAGFPARRRELFWPHAKMQMTFEWIQKAWAQEGRPSAWEASHLTPEHFPLLAELPRKEQAALFESVLPKLLFRSPPGYNSMGDIDEAASFVGFWMAAESRPELKGAFLAGLAKSPVEKILDPLLEIAADYPELRTPILRFLAVLLNLKGWFFTDQDLPWVNLIYLMNRIETQEQHLWMQEVNQLLLRGYSGMIGVPQESPLRDLTRPLEDPNSFGPDLNGFIRREAHHVGGAHVLDLALLRLHWWATQDKTPLVEYLRKLNTVKARETLIWLEDRETAPEAEELRSVLQQVLQGNREVEFLATAEEADLISVRKDLEEKGVPGLNRLFAREIPLVRLLWQMYAPRSAEAAVEAIQNLHRNHQGSAGWPGEKLERFLEAFRGEDRPAALQALAELHSAVRQEVLHQSGQGPSDAYPKWRQEVTQAELAAAAEDRHAIRAVRGYDPRNLNFQLYILLEYVRPLAGQLAGRLVRQAQQEPGWPDQANLLKGLLQWLKAAGPGSQSLEDLLELAGSENLTLARLQLIGKQLLAYLGQMAARQDKQIGETIDAVASVLQEGRMNPEILEGMGLKTSPPGRILEPRLRPHLGRQILAHRQAVTAARTFATLLGNRLNQLGGEELLRPIRTGSGESQKAPRDWVPLTAPIAESGGLDHLGNKFRNLMLLRQWGHPVPPAVGFPIGEEAQEVVRRMKEGVAQVEGQIRDRDLKEELGARFADPENPLLLSVRSGALVDLPGQLATLENVGIHLNLLPALEKRIGSWAAWDAYRRFVQDFAVSVYGSRHGFTPELFDRIIERYKQEKGAEKKIQLSAEQMREIALEYDRAVQLRVPGGIPEDPWKQLELAIQAVVDSWEQPHVQPILGIFGLQHEKGTAVILQAMIHGNFSREGNEAEGHERSGAGVTFVSSDGDVPGKGFVGSFGQGAQGSDVADGVIIPEPLSRLGELMPEVFKELQDRARDIQERSGEGSEIEFTVQDGRPWILQNRFVPIRGKAPKFRRETVGASVPLGRGEGLAGGAVRGILAFPKSLEDPVRLDQFNRLAAESGAEGLLLVMDTAAPGDTRFLRLPGVKGFLAHRGGPGQHEGMIATFLGLTAVAGLSGMELDRDNPAGGVSFHADPLRKDPGVRLKEGDLVSMDGFSGAVYPGRLPLATDPSAAPAAGPSAGLRTGLEEIRASLTGLEESSLAYALDYRRTAQSVTGLTIQVGDGRDALLADGVEYAAALYANAFFKSLVGDQPKEGPYRILLTNEGRVLGDRLERGAFQGLRFAAKEAGVELQIMRRGALPKNHALYQVQARQWDGALLVGGGLNGEGFNGLEFVGPEGRLLSREAMDLLIDQVREIQSQTGENPLLARIVRAVDSAKTESFSEQEHPLDDIGREYRADAQRLLDLHFGIPEPLTSFEPPEEPNDLQHSALVRLSAALALARQVHPDSKIAIVANDASSLGLHEVTRRLEIPDQNVYWVESGEGNLVAKKHALEIQGLTVFTVEPPTSRIILPGFLSHDPEALGQVLRRAQERGLFPDFPWNRRVTPLSQSGAVVLSADAWNILQNAPQGLARLTRPLLYLFQQRTYPGLSSLGYRDVQVTQYVGQNAYNNDRPLREGSLRFVLTRDDGQQEMVFIRRSGNVPALFRVIVDVVGSDERRRELEKAIQELLEEAIQLEAGAGFQPLPLPGIALAPDLQREEPVILSLGLSWLREAVGVPAIQQSSEFDVLKKAIADDLKVREIISGIGETPENLWARIRIYLSALAREGEFLGLTSGERGSRVSIALGAGYPHAVSTQIRRGGNEIVLVDLSVFASTDLMELLVSDALRRIQLRPDVFSMDLRKLMEALRGDELAVRRALAGAVFLIGQKAQWVRMHESKKEKIRGVLETRTSSSLQVGESYREFLTSFDKPSDGIFGEDVFWSALQVLDSESMPDAFVREAAHALRASRETSGAQAWQAVAPLIRKIQARVAVNAAGPSTELRTGLEEVQQALERLGTLEQVWKAPPAVEAPSRPILLDATDEEAVRHLGQALAIFLGRDNRADRILDFRLVIPESLRERTMNELGRVDLKLALHFLEGRLVSYDGMEKSRFGARQEAASALVPDLPAGETPQDLAQRGELLLVESIRGDLNWALQLRRYLEPAGLQILDDAAQRLKVLLEAA